METYEEKYKDLVKRLNKAREEKGVYTFNSVLDAVAPELKEESEDERMRNAAINACKYMVDNFENSTKQYEDAIAWLEKQGEHANFINKIQIDDKVTRNEDGVIVNLSQLKRVAKPADKVEPKFHEGDWIIGDKDNSVHQVKNSIENVSNGKYAYDLIDGGYISTSHESDYHLWTIQDAKDGDVLSFNDGHGNDSIELIKSVTGKKIEFWFCLTNGNRYEVFDGVVPYTNFASREDATPATKEQRDLLFQKMKEVGYEWDVEYKQLNKIEQNPAWSEEDELRLDDIKTIIEESIFSKVVKDKNLNWLKSLRPQFHWKPSDEQMDGIECTIKTLKYQLNAGDNRLDSLYADLKKLKGE